MQNDYREMPIERPILPWTGLPDGDDSGHKAEGGKGPNYREVPIDEGDTENPDPLVVVDGMSEYLSCHPIAAMPLGDAVSPYYTHDLGAPRLMLAREPAARAFIEAAKLVRGYGIQLTAIDLFRSYETQVAEWRQVFLGQVLPARGFTDPYTMSVEDFVRCGDAADDTAAFYAIAKNDLYDAIMEQVVNDGLVVDAAAVLGKPVEVIANKFLTYKRNLGADIPVFGGLQFDLDSTTAHGGGGAGDFWPFDMASGKPLLYGCHYDCNSPVAVMDWFEFGTVEELQAMIEADWALKRYYAAYGITRVTREAFNEIRARRRILFHAMAALGCSFFSLGRTCGEPWHWNGSNTLGGRQASYLPNSGNGCQAVLKDTRHPQTGAVTAVWGNRTGHRLAREILSRA